MRFRRQRNDEVLVNLTPLIDVVFLLLIFFMVSTTFTRETALQIDLPKASTVGSPTPGRRIEIGIDKHGHMKVDNTPLADSSLETLKQALRAVSAGDNQLPLLISADGKTPHQAVVTAMEAAGQLGFSRLGIAAEESGHP